MRVRFFSSVTKKMPGMRTPLNEILQDTSVGIRTLFNFAHTVQFCSLLNFAQFYLANALTRRLSRETFRAAALACTIPFWAARMTNGWAARRAAAAAPGSPAAIACSTLRT
jgi:hypothetical protein